MKKIFTVALCLMIGCSMAFGQTSKEERVQKILEKNQQKELYRAELEDAMLGFRQGAEYSLRTFGTAGVMGAKKHGFHYLAGYRFTKHWYVGGIVGVDLTTPFTITREGYMDDALNYSIEREDKVYVPVIADVRFYFKPKRVSTYLFTNLGAEFSSSTAAIVLFGLGWDVHTVKDQCVNIGLGVGMGSWETAEGTHMATLDGGNVAYDKYDGFVFNFKLGYSF
jgi:hypothetical protein